MPRRLRPLLAALALAALAAGGLAVPAGSALGVPCWPLGLGRVLQNDNGSGRDAPDVNGPDDVPIVRDAYVWGQLDPPVATGGADLSDWYSFDVPNGSRDVGFRVVSTMSYDVPDVELPYVITYFADIWTPGAAAPAVTLNSTMDGNWTAHSGTGGRWFVHVYELPDASLPALCSGDALPPLPLQLGVLPTQLMDYGVYAGCNPLCFAS